MNVINCILITCLNVHCVVERVLTVGRKHEGLLMENLIKKIMYESNDLHRYVENLNLPNNMCDICKFLFMDGLGYSLGFERINSTFDKYLCVIEWEQRFRWITPQEIEQGYLNGKKT